MIWIIIAIIVVLVIFVIASYNGLVKSRMQTKEAWSQIDVQLKRRNDLLPNLIETVKGYAKYEGSTLEKVAELLGDDGRILVRESGTEPVIRVMVEAKTDHLAEKYVNQVIKVIEDKGHAV